MVPFQTQRKHLSAVFIRHYGKMAKSKHLPSNQLPVACWVILDLESFSCSAIWKPVAGLDYSKRGAIQSVGARETTVKWRDFWRGKKNVTTRFLSTKHRKWITLTESWNSGRYQNDRWTTTYRVQWLTFMKANENWGAPRTTPPTPLAPLLLRTLANSTDE